MLKILLDTYLKIVYTVKNLRKEGPELEHYDVFINYKRSHSELAGMIYMYFQQKGLVPFWDVQSLGQVVWTNALSDAIDSTPYFLSVLTKDSLEDLDNFSSHDIYYKELEEGLNTHAPENILLIASHDFQFPDKLPWRINSLRDHQYYRFKENLSDFFYQMDRLFKRDIDISSLSDTSDWRSRVNFAAKTLVLPRKQMEGKFVTPADQFGKYFVQCAADKTPFHGKYKVKHINMACSAANMVFLPDSNSIDALTRDSGRLARTYKALLEDEDFSFHVVTYAPFSAPTVDQIVTGKFGSTAVKYPQAAFLGTYANVHDFIKNDPVYKKASEQNRFEYYVTDSFMPCSVLQVEYKPEWSAFNHVNISLYSEGIANTSERLSMVFFEENDKANYDFFAHHFQHLIEYSRKQNLGELNKENWLNQWENYQRTKVLS